MIKNNVKIRRVDNAIPLPKYHTKGSVGFDFYVRETTKIKAKSLGLVPLNNIIKVPKNMVLLIFARSSLARKKGLVLSNSVGVIDQDYCGPEDEIKASVYNFTDKDVIVEKGERIVQGIFLPVFIANFTEVQEITQKSRGGFGSTGNKYKNKEIFIKLFL